MRFFMLAFSFGCLSDYPTAMSVHSAMENSPPQELGVACEVHALPYCYSSFDR